MREYEREKIKKNQRENERTQMVFRNLEETGQQEIH